MKKRCRSLDALKSTARAFGARLSSAPAVQSREHACAFVAGLPLVPLSVVGVWLEPRHAQAYARACSADDLMLVTVSNDCVSGWQADWHISPKARAADYWAACFGSGFNWQQLVS